MGVPTAATTKQPPSAAGQVQQPAAPAAEQVQPPAAAEQGQQPAAAAAEQQPSGAVQQSSAAVAAQQQAATAKQQPSAAAGHVQQPAPVPAVYKHSGLPEGAKEVIINKLGKDRLQWPTEAKLPSAFFVGLLRYLSCEHGEVADGSVAWVKRVSSWVQSERGKARKKQKRSVEFVESEFGSGTEIEVQEEGGSWEAVVMYRRQVACDEVVLWFKIANTYEGLDPIYNLVGEQILDADSNPVVWRAVDAGGGESDEADAADDPSADGEHADELMNCEPADSEHGDEPMDLDNLGIEGEGPGGTSEEAFMQQCMGATQEMDCYPHLDSDDDK